MKIVVLGAGQVGSTVAQSLAKENNDVTVVDVNAAVLAGLNNRLDLRTVQGRAPFPEVMRRAGIEDADLLIAATSSDEVNMVACQIASSLFRTPTKIARIRAAEYAHESQLFCREHLPIDRIISPERLVTRHVQRLVEFPGALQVMDFADGRVQLVVVRAVEGGPMVGEPLRALPQHLPGVDTRVAALYRDGQAIIPRGDTVVNADDEVFFLAATEHARRVMHEMRRREGRTRRVVIAGGGNVGRALAENLERHYSVKVIERSDARADALSQELSAALVLHGDVSDHELLVEENIGEADFFCALTNDEEVNILSAMLAKRLGASNVVALVNRDAYHDLMPQTMIDIAVAPNTITVSALLSHIRRGDVVAVHALRGGAAEAIEAIAHGDRETSQVVGRSISEIALPPDTMIGCIVRGEQVLMGHHDLVIESEDHMILLVADKSRMLEVERLFQVAVTFI